MFKLKRKQRPQAVNEKRLSEIVKKELGGYVSREGLQEYLDGIEKDKRKKRLWDSLSTHKKIVLLRYVLAKKGESCGKK